MKHRRGDRRVPSRASAFRFVPTTGLERALAITTITRGWRVLIDPASISPPRQGLVLARSGGPRASLTIHAIEIIIKSRKMR